jgi:hypothetical protein
MYVQPVGTDGIVNGGLSNHFTLTLSQATSLKFVNFDSGQTFTLIIQQDAGGSKYAVTWPAGLTFQAGTPPNLNTNASGIDVFRFTCTDANANTYRDTDGAPSKLPARIAVGALAAMTLLNTGMSLHLSAGAGSGTAEIGRLSPVQDVYSGTGAGTASGTWMRRDDGSGSTKTGKFGGLAVGVNTKTDRLDAAGNSGVLLPNGKMTLRNLATVSGAKITNAPASQGIVCGQTGGLLRFCRGAATVVGGILTCTCQ